MYKNWKGICQIADTHFMWALALLDLATDLGRMVAERFPEYFSNEQQAGPFPLSVFFEKARSEKGEGFSEEYIVSNGTVAKFNIPLIEFGVDERGADENNLPLLPLEIDFEKIRSDNNENAGLKIEWKGKQLVMLEYNEHIGSVSFAPTELIIVDK